MALEAPLRSSTNRPLSAFSQHTSLSPDMPIKRMSSPMGSLASRSPEPSVGGFRSPSPWPMPLLSPSDIVGPSPVTSTGTDFDEEVSDAVEAENAFFAAAAAASSQQAGSSSSYADQQLFGTGQHQQQQRTASELRSSSTSDLRGKASADRRPSNLGANSSASDVRGGPAERRITSDIHSSPVAERRITTPAPVDILSDPRSPPPATTKRMTLTTDVSDQLRRHPQESNSVVHAPQDYGQWVSWARAREGTPSL
jgi:hypothetical protein